MATNKKVTALRHRNSSPTQLRARPRIRQYSTGVGANGSNGPGSLSDQEMREKRFSKTLPRGFSLANSEAAGAEFSDVYGLYGDLLNVTDYSFVEGQGDQKASQHNGKHNGGKLVENNCVLLLNKIFFRSHMSLLKNGRQEERNHSFSILFQKKAYTHYGQVFHFD